MAQAGFTPISLYYSTTASAAPTSGNLVNGELAINITDGKLYYKDNLGVVKSFSSGGTAYVRTSFTATAGQTTFSATYSVGYVEVYLNGVLLNAADYTASNGTSVVLATGAALNDIVELIAFQTTAITVASATNLLGGAASQLVYQSGASTTGFIANGTSGQYLVSNGASAPSWGTLAIPSGTTIVNPTITNYTETRYAPAAGSSFTIDLTNGTIQQFSLNANGTITLPSSVSGKSFIVIVTYSGAYTLTWAGGSTIKWPGGTVPTASSANGKFDIFTFFQDGTNTYGNSFGLNY